MRDYSHTHLIRHFKAMGYDFRASGVCAGLAQMSIQAFLAGREEFARFNQRLELIATNSPEELSNRIRKAREAIAERSRKKRLEVKSDANEIVIVELTEEEELLTETEAFFGGIELYHDPEYHRDFFSKLVSQPEVQEILPFMESTTLVEQGGMRVIDSFPGIYSLVELQDYFNRLTQILLHYCPPCDLAMGLACVNHRISILFDKTRGLWIMSDANNLPPKELLTGAELADAVLEALAKNTGEGERATKVAFNTTVYATERNELQVKKRMDKVKQSVEFSRAHAVTLGKVKERTEGLTVSLATIAAKCGHKDVLKLIAAAKPGALNEGSYLGYTPLHAAAELNLPKLVKILVDEKVPLETRNQLGQSPLELAISRKSMEAMILLLDEQKDLASAVVNASGWLPLHVAAQKNNVEAIKLLVQKGANPLAELAGGWSAVSIAAENGQVEALKALIAIVSPMNLEKASYDGTTPLMQAVKGGHAQIVAVLAEAKIDFNKKNRAGKSALHLAVEKKDLAVVKALILGGATVDVEDNDGNTPLHLAAEQNQKEMFDLLMEHGASMRKSNRAGKTPLSSDFIGGDVLGAFTLFNLMLQKIDGLQRRLTERDDCQAILKQLKKEVVKSYHKAAFSEFYSELTPEAGLAFVAAENDNSAALLLLRAEEKIDFEAKSASGWLPLHRAVINGSKKIIDILIRDKGSLSHEIKSSGATAAYLAAEGGFTDILRKLVAHLPPAVLNKANAKNETPLYAAVANGHDQTAQLLLEAKVDVNRAANSGWSPIHQAIEKNHFKIFQMLVEVADLNKEVGTTGVTPVALAAEHGRSEFLRILIRKAPAVNIRKKSANGRTPLMRAVHNRHVKAAKMLIDALEAKDLNEKDNNGESALHRAIENNDIELVQALIEKGADVNLVKGRFAETPIQLAVMGHKVEIVNLLRKNGAVSRKADTRGQSALSIGTPLADATTRKKELFIVIEAWMEELEQAHPGQILPAAVNLEFASLKQLIEDDFEAHYEAFFRRYDERTFAGNDYLLLAFIAAAKGYKYLLEVSLPKIDASAKNPAGFSLSQVAEVYNHAELVRLLHDYEQGHERKGQGDLPAVGLFGSKAAVAHLSIEAKGSELTGTSYDQLKEKILEEALRIENEVIAQHGYNPSRHRKILKYVEIRKKLAECDKAAAQYADKYHYLKSQCEEKGSLLHHALHIKTGVGAESAGSTSKNVFAKIAELDTLLAAKGQKPDP